MEDSVALSACKSPGLTSRSSEDEKKPNIGGQVTPAPAKLESSETLTRASESFDPLDEAVVTKMDETNWKKWTREELLRAFLPLHAEVFNDKNAEPFREPVDSVALNIPDYPRVVKHPMDLTTIRNKLSEGLYKDPWKVLDDFRLMYNNAWLYNKKTSKVYKM